MGACVSIICLVYYNKSGADITETNIFFFLKRHGGKQVSQYLSKRLHALIEQVDSTSIRPIVEWTKEKHEGYFKRWRGGALQRWTQWADGEAAEGEGGREEAISREGKGNEAGRGEGKMLMTLEERLTLAFLQASFCSLHFIHF